MEGVLLKIVFGFCSLFSPFRVCDAALARRFYVWIPVPEWVQSCLDPKMHRVTKEISRDYGNGRMQFGEKSDSGRGNKGINIEWIYFSVKTHQFKSFSGNV